MSDKGGEFFFGFVIGALAGAAAALLMAPASGEETRHKLDEKRLELQGQAQKLAEEAKTQAQKLADEAKSQTLHATESAQSQFTHMQERGRIVLSDSVKKAQQTVQDVQTRLSKPAGAEEAA